MKNILKRLLIGVSFFIVGVSVFAQSLLGSWYEDTLWERSRFRKYFYRINDKQLSVIDKKNNTETLFDYYIKNGYITIKSKGATSEKILAGSYEIIIQDDNYFTINFPSPMSFVRNSYAKEQAVGAVKTSAIIAATGFAIAATGAIGEKAVGATLAASAGASGQASAQNFSQSSSSVASKLLPNHTYTSCGYDYKTDKLGRIVNYSGKLRRQDGVRNKDAQSIARHMGGGAKDDGGHLFATIFGGSGELDNLVPMSQSTNRGAYKKLENLWARELSKGKDVFVSGQCVYEGDSLRPIKFIVKYIIDGVTHKEIILNK